MGLFGIVLACGPGKASDSAGSSGELSTGETSTGETTTTGTPTTGGESSGGDTGGDAICPPGWELPASVTASLKLAIPDASVGEFDPAMVYPDGTAAACVRWDGAALAGARLAIGPAVGEGPQALLEVVVEDGEREYGTSMFPPEPGAYDGMSAVFTLFAAGEPPRVWDFEADQGIGMLWVTWVPRRTGEHIILDAKLEMPADGTGAQVGFTIDAVVAPASPATDMFCEGLDDGWKCELAGCAGWVETALIVDPTTCASKASGLCVAELVSTNPDSYDSTFWRMKDGAVQLRPVGGEACTPFGAEHPAGWSECGAGPDDPPQCACVCAMGVCPGDAALATLDGCGLAKPCPDIDSFGEVDPQTYDCAFQALAAGAPAALRIHVNLGDPDWHDRVYLRGDGSASWLHGGCDVSCVGSCEDRDWGVPRVCSLREAAYFDNCAATQDLDELTNCQDVFTWFTGCVADSPASCP